MNIDVMTAAPATIDVKATKQTVEVSQSVVSADVVARTVQPELAGMFVEYLGDGDYTIWIEDGN